MIQNTTNQTITKIINTITTNNTNLIGNRTTNSKATTTKNFETPWIKIKNLTRRSSKTWKNSLHFAAQAYQNLNRAFSGSRLYNVFFSNSRPQRANFLNKIKQVNLKNFSLCAQCEQIFQEEICATMENYSSSAWNSKQAFIQSFAGILHS